MQRRLAVIFVSRRDSLRAILAKACLLHLGAQRFAAYSCGQPGQIAPAIHPAALQALEGAGIAPPAGAPRSWDELVRSGAPAADFVITLDADTLDRQPRWPGQPDAALWAFADIAASEAGATVQAATLMLYALRRRLELLVSLPMQGADRAAIRSDLRDLAHLG